MIRVPPSGRSRRSGRSGDRGEASVRRIPAIAVGVVLGAMPVAGLAVWTVVDGDGGTDAAAHDGAVATSSDAMIGLVEPSAIIVPLPDPADISDAPPPPDDLDVVVAIGVDGPFVDEISEADWLATSPATRSVVPSMVPIAMRDEVDVLPVSVRVAGVDDVTLSFRTESGATGHAVGAGAIADTVVPLYFLQGRDETIRVIAASPRGESVVASIALAGVVGSGGLEVTGSGLGSIRVRALGEAEIASRLGLEVDDLDDYRQRHLTL